MHKDCTYSMHKVHRDLMKEKKEEMSATIERDSGM
jgi:hypothetical protein